MTTPPRGLVPLSPGDNDTPRSLGTLPDELTQLILAYLPHSDLKSVALVSRCLNAHATDPLWRKVVLMDTWKLHLNDETRTLWSDRGQGRADEHDDTPIIEKLFILAKNPRIASKVQVVTHCCHLPTPGIFSELQYMHFDSDSLSPSDYLRYLVQLAIRNLVNVHTLKIVCGHKTLTSYLLESFLNPARPRRLPLRKLWLESCSLIGAKIDFGSRPTGLESIRIRRTRAERKAEVDDQGLRFPEFRVARWGHHFRLHDGAGGFYQTPVDTHFDAPHRPRPVTAEEINEKTDAFEDAIWESQREVARFVEDHASFLTSEPQATAPTIPLLHLLETSPTVTKLNLDWVIWRSINRDNDEPGLTILQSLSRQRFPHLRAFQVRNAVVAMTKLPNISLLETTFLDFLEAHPKIQCLAFPLDRFYSHNKPSQDVLTRSRRLVAHFGMVLVDLRLDSCYNNYGDPISDDGAGGLEKEQERIRRRRFITEFAPFMTKIQHIKLEGGIPRDEKREILRALHSCALERIIMIGATFPVGNTWGYRGEDLKKVDEGEANSSYDLEEEDREALINTFATSPTVEEPFEFKASYGWPPSPAFLHTIAAHHADTVEELKICGFNGSPVLSNMLSITRPLLAPLGRFHNLRQLIISLWLVKYFEHDHRDVEIIQSWKDTRSASSTALVVVTPPSTPPVNPVVTPTVAPRLPDPAARPQEFNRWAVALKTRFTPSALAYRIAADIGPFLSPIAKERKGGVRVRASFLLGMKEEQRSANDIFDLDIRIGQGNQVLEFVGPREEGEKGRWWDKMEERRWF